MPTAFILSDVTSPWRCSRAKQLGLLLSGLGFTTRVFGKEICDKQRSSNLETQSGSAVGSRIDYADRIRGYLKGVKPGDIIVATEQWHSDCFRGLLSEGGGFYNNAPVIEMWIDYRESFAKYRVFSSRFAMYTTAADLHQCYTHENWIVAKPWYQAKLLPSALTEAVINSDDLFSTDFMERHCAGSPIVAPDWGVCAEFITHGTSGYLYRTTGGYTQVLGLAQEMDSSAIVEHINSTFSYEEALGQIARFVTRVADGREHTTN